VQYDFFVLCTDEMIDDVRGRRITTGIAEPFRADEAFNDVCWIVDATVADGILSQQLLAKDA
jgi:hypothetical protein